MRDLDAQKIQIRVIRRLLLKSIQTVAKYPKDNNTSSLCAYLKSYKKEDLSMFKVELDSSPNSTLYYNAYGYLDPFLKSFSNNSRFCIFNINIVHFLLILRKMITMLLVTHSLFFQESIMSMSLI